MASPRVFSTHALPIMSTGLLSRPAPSTIRARCGKFHASGESIPIPLRRRPFENRQRWYSIPVLRPRESESEKLELTKSIQKFLEYNFNPLCSHERSKELEIKDLDESFTLAMIGMSAVQLVMLDLDKRRKKMFDNKALQAVGKVLGLHDYIIDPKTYTKMEPDSYEKFQIPATIMSKLEFFHVDTLSLRVAGLFGAVHLDGGLDALKKLLHHVHFFDPAVERAGKPEEIGITACELLFISSFRIHTLYGSKIIDKCRDKRCSEKWHKLISTDKEKQAWIEAHPAPDVRKVLDNYVSPSRGFRAFLGTLYRHGGLRLVQQALNTVDPGLNCPKYFTTIQKRLVEIEKEMKVPFW